MPGLLQDKLFGIKPTLFHAEASALFIVAAVAVLLFFGLLLADYIMAKKVERRLEQLKREARERYLGQVAPTQLPVAEPTNLMHPEFRPELALPDAVAASRPVGSQVLQM